MSRSGAGVYSPTAGIPVVSGTTISSTVFNNLITDIGNEITASLPVAGTAPMTGALRATLGSVSAPGYTFTGDTDTGIYSTGTNSLSIGTGGTAALTVSSAQVTTWTAKAIGKAFDVDAITSVASASTCDIGAAATGIVNITGTTTITSFGTSNAGIFRRGYFSGALTLTHNGTSLILPGRANITTAANDSFEALSLGSGNWIVTDYRQNLAGVGGMVLLTSGTAASVATLDLTLTSGYRAFKLLVHEFTPVTNGSDMYVRFSQNSGSSYVATGYEFGVLYNNSANLTGSWASSSTITTAFLVMSIPRNTAGDANSAEFIIYPGGGSINPRLSWVANYISTTPNTLMVNGAGGLNTAGTATNVRFLTSSGNITTLRYSLYGIL